MEHSSLAFDQSRLMVLTLR